MDSINIFLISILSIIYARLLKSTSEFGMHLDSLSDFVVFGAVPAFSIYLWMESVLVAPVDNNRQEQIHYCDEHQAND